MREQIDSHDEFRSTVPLPDQSILNLVLFCLVILSNIVSDLFPVSLLVSFPSCLSSSLLFLLSFPSCPSTSLLFHSISSRILFNLFFAVPGILIVIVEIKSRVWSPVMDTNTWHQFNVVRVCCCCSNLSFDISSYVIVRTNQSCFQFWILLCTVVVRNSSSNIDEILLLMCLTMAKIFLTDASPYFNSRWF